ncbi:MAG: hypothetical protein DSY80_04795, partial [Desulfocapsa sp.]
YTVEPKDSGLKLDRARIVDCKRISIVVFPLDNGDSRNKLVNKIARKWIELQFQFFKNSATSHHLILVTRLAERKSMGPRLEKTHFAGFTK